MHLVLSVHLEYMTTQIPLSLLPPHHCHRFYSRTLGASPSDAKVHAQHELHCCTRGAGGTHTTTHRACLPAQCNVIVKFNVRLLSLWSLSVVCGAHRQACTVSMSSKLRQPPERNNQALGLRAAMKIAAAARPHWCSSGPARGSHKQAQ